MVVWLWPVSEPSLADCPASRHWGQDLVFTVSGADACRASAGLEAQCAGLAGIKVGSGASSGCGTVRGRMGAGCPWLRGFYGTGEFPRLLLAARFRRAAGSSHPACFPGAACGPGQPRVAGTGLAGGRLRANRHICAAGCRKAVGAAEDNIAAVGSPLQTLPRAPCRSAWRDLGLSATLRFI